MTRPLPSQEDLVSLAEAALSNAAALLDDAVLLAEAGRFPRAYALATLACEEAGKSDHCLHAMQDPFSPEWFWECFNNHHEKLGAVLSHSILASDDPIAPGPWLSGRVRDDSRTAHIRKLRGLYVDFREGTMQIPEEIGQQEALDMISAAEALIDKREGSLPGRIAEAQRVAAWPASHREVYIIFHYWFAATEHDLAVSFLRRGELSPALEEEWRPVVKNVLQKLRDRVEQVGVAACLAEIAERLSLFSNRVTFKQTRLVATPD
jgi:AbiV family abortive infection protein